MLRVHLCGKPGKGFSALATVANKRDFRWPSSALREWVALLAMKHGRAPLPVSRGLERALMRQGLAADPAELGDLARRYLFLGDALMLLAESRKHLAPISNFSEAVKPLSKETPTQSEIGVRYPCP